jgi:hypothetical protein
MKTLQRRKPICSNFSETAAANKMLSKRIVTVMDKQMTPSSGDKHDYMSMGRYWWPDNQGDGLLY